MLNTTKEVEVLSVEIANAGAESTMKKALVGHSAEVQYLALKGAASHILEAVEVNIASKNHSIAIWELSKLAVVEDMLLNAERKVNHVHPLVAR